MVSHQRKGPTALTDLPNIVQPQLCCICGPQKWILFYFCCLELSKLNGGFKVYSPAMNQPFSVKPVRTQK